jgi:hypothetical protein
VDVQCWARDPEDFGKKRLRRQLSIEQKESYKQKARQAQLEMRFAQVHLKPPPGKERLGELSIWAIFAQEKDAPRESRP